MMKEFTIEQVFTVKKVYGRSQKTYGIGDTAYVTGAKNNNGVVGFVKADDKSISKGNCISVDPITGMSCYQPVDFVGRGFSGASINLLYNDNLNEKTALFVCSVIEKVASSVAAYTNLFNSTRLATAKISLPVIESSDPNHVYTVDDIDWQYMQDRIAELEQDRIAELEAYLAATGLDDYELTDEDKAVLCDEKKMRKDFKVKDVLPPIKVTKYAKKPESEGNVPFVSCQTTNNGIAIYCGEKPEIKHCITVSTNGNCFDCFWHGYPIIPSSDVEVLSKDGITDNERISLYLCGLLAPNTALYSYVNKPKNGKVFDTIISLPVIVSPDPNHTYTIDDIDFDYMERYIRAMEKLAIADVVKYKDKVIATTKEVVAQQ